jgi:hypothetical protein
MQQLTITNVGVFNDPHTLHSNAFQPERALIADVLNHE